MALTLVEIQELRRQGKYRETISAVDKWKEEGFPGTIGVPADRSPFFLEKAWAHYQLGEYEAAEQDAKSIAEFMSAGTDIGESARHLLAHCAERQGRLDDAEEQLRALPSSRNRDNLYVVILVARKRQGEPVDVLTAMNLVTEALRRTPYDVVDGHIINNGAWLLYNAREQEGVRPVLPILSGLIEMAIGIYEATGTAPNHRAGALFRASNIFLDVADWPKAALLVIDESIVLWEQLVASEDGKRYQQNLEGARSQREKILTRSN